MQVVPVKVTDKNKERADEEEEKVDRRGSEGGEVELNRNSEGNHPKLR